MGHAVHGIPKAAHAQTITCLCTHPTTPKRSLVRPGASCPPAFQAHCAPTQHRSSPAVRRTPCLLVAVRCIPPSRHRPSQGHAPSCTPCCCCCCCSLPQISMVLRVQADGTPAGLTTALESCAGHSCCRSDLVALSGSNSRPHHQHSPPVRWTTCLTMRCITPSRHRPSHSHSPSCTPCCCPCCYLPCCNTPQLGMVVRVQADLKLAGPKELRRRIHKSSDGAVILQNSLRHRESVSQHRE